MSDLAIKVQNLSKQYQLGEHQQAYYKTLRESIMGTLTAPFRHLKSIRFSHGLEPSALSLEPSNDFIWALEDVSFEIKRGEVVGIIGRNGAGKTTLLKILSRITEPTEGRAEIHGRVGSLLEVGTGFHPELTGRENIFLNGAILGMRKAEIEGKFDKIVAFAEIEKFIDTPVKRYSSGMYVRLAFSVAAHLEPEILLVDEVLAVGDAAFQKKCLGKMGDVAKEGLTVLFVSHNMAAIEGLCHSAYLLDQGHIMATGNAHEVVEVYISSLRLLDDQPLCERSDRQGDGRLRFTDMQFLGVDGAPIDIIQCGQHLRICIGYSSDIDALQNVVLSIGLYTMRGQCMLILNNEMVGSEFNFIPPAGQFWCSVDRFPLAPGHYYLNLFCEVNGVIVDWVQQAAHLTVEAGDFYGTGKLPPPGHGGLLIPHRWQVRGEKFREV
ncbi:MAG: ABC transporter ATP-binding protein [Thermodesulfobacteriota bacterium]|nr:ABC transporter ATP-binding protein [Thermodesulfobacteriota bacterium]